MTEQHAHFIVTRRIGILAAVMVGADRPCPFEQRYLLAQLETQGFVTRTELGFPVYVLTPAGHAALIELLRGLLADAESRTFDETTRTWVAPAPEGETRV